MLGIICEISHLTSLEKDNLQSNEVKEMTVYIIAYRELIVALFSISEVVDREHFYAPNN